MANQMISFMAQDVEIEIVERRLLLRSKATGIEFELYSFQYPLDAVVLADSILSELREWMQAQGDAAIQFDDLQKWVNANTSKFDSTVQEKVEGHRLDWGY